VEQVTAAALALLALAAQDSLDGALDALAAVPPGDAASYDLARKRVLSFGSAALPALAERAAPERWTADGWARALAAESCRLRLEDPGFAAGLDRPAGLDPARYRRFRRPEPMCLPELARGGPRGVPLLLERWRWTFDEHPYSPGEAGEAERRSFRLAILAAAGRAEDVRSRHLLREVLENGTLPESWRGEAALSLAASAGREALPPLSQVLDRASEPAAVRGACARALGRVPDLLALEAIRARLQDAGIRVPLLSALGWLGSEWGWKARGPAAADLAARVRQGAAETLIEALGRWPEEEETISRALALVAWEPSLRALEDLAGSGSSAARTALGRLKPALERRY
jgi:hypothetical protein